MAMSREEMLAKARVRALSEGVRCWRLANEEGRYCVPSSSEPGIAYEVVMFTDFQTCTCPSGMQRGACKHMAAVQLLRESETAMQTAREHGDGSDDWKVLFED